MIAIAKQQPSMPSLTEFSDEELIQRISAGDVNAYEGIMRRYNQRLFRVTRGILENDAEAMDVMQEAYLKAYDQLSTVKDIKALPAWLIRIVRNEALQYLRRNKRDVSMDPEYFDSAQLEPVLELETMIKTRDQPDSKVANEQLRQLLEASIDKLPSSFREVFILRAIEQSSVRETADILEIPEATVKTRYFRANALLQKQLGEHIQKSNIGLYEFAGHRCNAIVYGVLDRLSRR